MIPPAERLLVDRRLGLIIDVTRYRPRLPLPPSWVGWSAHGSRTSVFAPWQGERYSFGASFGDHDRARRAAVGEVVERYCGNAVPDDLPIASYAELTRAGRAALDPRTLALYSRRQYAARGFPFVPFTRDLPVAWVPGRDLHTGKPAMVPASLAYLNYFRGAHRAEPATHAMVYAGIATGENRAHAEVFALEELFERDANTIWWASGGPHRTVTDADDLLAELEVPADVTVRLFEVPAEFPVPVLAAFLEYPGREIISYGTACRADPMEAARKALAEAFAMLEYTAQLTEPDSAHWRAVARGDFPSHTFRRYRPDRLYADDIRDDFRDLVDLPAVAQLYLDPRMRGAPLDRLRCSNLATTFARIPRPPDRDGYLDLLAARGLPAYSVDVTTSDVRSAGLTVVRVVVPGLYGNPPAAFPLLGGERLYRVPVELGLVEGPLTEDTLYPYPIPHV
jgi:ribosomal protein S12 methylthiotransferase accessory factor